MQYQDRLSGPATRGGLKHLKIAIVENDVPVAPVLRSSLAMWEIVRTRVYEDGAEALSDIVGERKPDIVFLNWCGERYDPLRFARTVRDPEGFPHPFLPLVVVLSNVRREPVLAARDAGIDEFLAVPFTPKNLHDRIAAVVHERRAFVNVPTYFGPDRRRGASRGGGAEPVLLDPQSGLPCVPPAGQGADHGRVVLNI